MISTLPSPLAVRNLLEGLLGRDIETSPGIPLPPTQIAAIGQYMSDDARTTGVLALDLELAAYIGTSIALIPAGGAQAAIEDGTLSQPVFDNVAEVLNVFAHVLNEHSDVHQRLVGVYRSVGHAPAEVSAVAAALGNRVDLSITVSKYGTGSLSCALL